MFFPLPIPIGLIVSTCAAILATPLAMWALRTGKRNIIVYGITFWFFLAVYIFCAPSFNHDRFAIIGGVVLTVLGLVIIGLIPKAR
jgi:hypothetical protein